MGCSAVCKVKDGVRINYRIYSTHGLTEILITGIFVAGVLCEFIFKKKHIFTPWPVGFLDNWFYKSHSLFVGVFLHALIGASQRPIIHLNTEYFIKSFITHKTFFMSGRFCYPLGILKWAGLETCGQRYIPKIVKLRRPQLLTYWLTDWHLTDQTRPDQTGPYQTVPDQIRPD